MYQVLLLQQYTFYKGTHQDMVNVLSWTEVLHFRVTVLVSEYQYTKEKELNLALELNQGSLSPKELIYAHLKENL